MTQQTFINLHPIKYSQGLNYHPFAMNLERCVEVVILLMTYLNDL